MMFGEKRTATMKPFRGECKSTKNRNLYSHEMPIEIIAFTAPQLQGLCTEKVHRVES